MNKLRNNLILILTLFVLFACDDDNTATKSTKNIPPPPKPWIDTVEPIIIDGDEFYGKTCSVIRISKKDNIKTDSVIFNVPWKALTSCFSSAEGVNYLDYDGEYIILNVYRQTFGAGSSTGERYRSKDFENWEEYIGVTWRNSEEYEAWRKVGSDSSKADSIKKVESE